MRGYSILTNKKRTIVALAHSIVFLLIAMRGLMGAVRPLHGPSPASAWAIFGIYLVVSSVLLILTAASGAMLERLYFALCTSSATFGLLRTILGDPRMHLAVYVRVAMLLGAVLAGSLIWRGHRPATAKPAGPVGEQA